MARSRKSNKAKTKGETGVETPDNDKTSVASEALEDAVSQDKTDTDDATAIEDGPKPDEIEAVAEDVSDAEPTAEDTPEVETLEADATAEGMPEAPETDETPSVDDTSRDADSPDGSEADQDAETAADSDTTDGDTEGKEPSAEDAAQDDTELVEGALAAEAADVSAEEPDTEAVTETAKEPEKPKPEPRREPQVVQGSVWPAFFGGVIAAMIGFIAGKGDMLDGFFGPDEQPPAIDVAAIEATAAEQAAALDAQASLLEAQVARLEALETVSTDAIEETVLGLEANIETLAERIAALESRPAETVVPEPGVDPEAVTELQAALDAQKAQIAELAARAEDAEAQAAGEAARILARAALLRVVTAVDSGEAFSPALTELEDVTPVEVPEPLRAAAETGVPTLASLQESFPDAARTALAVARAEVPEAEVVGITEFLKRQLNVRSVTPREGDDPDAILSRAQAAVNAGDIGTALMELDGLSEAARASMTDWLEAASARQAAQDAANALADSLNSN